LGLINLEVINNNVGANITHRKKTVPRGCWGLVGRRRKRKNPKGGEEKKETTIFEKTELSKDAQKNWE